MNTVNHERLTAMRQNPHYGPILDRALKAWFDPLIPSCERVRPRRHGFGSYPNGDPSIIVGSSSDHKDVFAPGAEKSCCLLGAARIGLPASFSRYSAALKITPEEVCAITAGFDAENEPELELALYGFKQYVEAVEFGHRVAVSLGLPFDQLDQQNRQVIAAFVAFVDTRPSALINNEPALLTIRRTAKGVGLSLPGGSVEPGESPAAAAVRETWEEIGAVVSKRALTVLGTWDWEGKPITTYLVDLACISASDVRFDVETVDRVYHPEWRPVSVLCTDEAAFPDWSAHFCHLLRVYLATHNDPDIQEI